MGGQDDVVQAQKGVVRAGRFLIKDVQAGGGIVADSDPESEFQETRSKARALIRAAEEAVRFAAGRG